MQHGLPLFTALHTSVPPSALSNVFFYVPKHNSIVDQHIPSVDIRPAYLFISQPVIDCDVL